VHGTGSGSFPMGGFCIKDAEPSCSAPSVLSSCYYLCQIHECKL
jgi:hypothetical protein